jgi:hypothetical protein
VRAYGENYTPLSDIRVILYSDNTPIGESKTDEDGISKFIIPCDGSSPYETTIVAINPETNISSNDVKIRCVRSPNCSPPSPSQPIDTPIKKRPCCYDSDCWGSYVGERTYEPSATDLMKFGFDQIDAEEIAKEKLCIVKCAICSDPYGRLIEDLCSLECRPFSLVNASDIVWLWIKTDLDCKNVRCTAFFNDSYAYRLTYYPERDAYRYFIQYPVRKKIVYEIINNVAHVKEEKYIINQIKCVEL